MIDELEQANAEAQRRFRAMLDARTYGDPHAPETKLYALAERIVDELIVAAQWEATKASLDAWTEPELREAWGR